MFQGSPLSLFAKSTAPESSPNEHPLQSTREGAARKLEGPRHVGGEVRSPEGALLSSLLRCSKPEKGWKQGFLSFSSGQRNQPNWDHRYAKEAPEPSICSPCSPALTTETWQQLCLLHTAAPGIGNRNITALQLWGERKCQRGVLLGHLGLHLDPARADLLHEWHCLCYSHLAPVPPRPCAPWQGATCRLTGYSAGAPHTGSGWHRAPPSAPPRPPIPQTGWTF